MLIPRKNLLDPKENCDVEEECCDKEEPSIHMSMEESVVRVIPYADHYEEYDTGEGIPDTEPVEEG